VLTLRLYYGGAGVIAGGYSSAAHSRTGQDGETGKRRKGSYFYNVFKLFGMIVPICLKYVPLYVGLQISCPDVSCRAPAASCRSAWRPKNCRKDQVFLVARLLVVG